MTAGCELGIYKRVVHRNLKAPSVRRKQGKAFDLRFEVLQQLIGQANGPVGKMSDHTI